MREEMEKIWIPDTENKDEKNKDHSEEKESSFSLGKEGEKKDSQEREPSRERAITKFKEFIKDRKESIEKESKKSEDLEDLESRSLAEIIYRDFYCRDVDNLKYKEDDPEIKQLKTYNKSVEDIWERLLERYKKEAKTKEEVILPGKDSYWLYCETNGGFLKEGKEGRIYLNLKPKEVSSFFSKAVEAFQSAGLHIRTKIPREGNAETFNRFDKMVVYFSEKEEEKVVEVLENLYNQDAFDEDTPAFTGEIRDKKGEVMRGIGFGEKPSIPHVSFGQIRSRILSVVYRQAKDSGLEVYDPEFDFKKHFQEACKKHNVNPDNPAFNLSTTAEEFVGTRERMGLQKS